MDERSAHHESLKAQLQAQIQEQQAQRAPPSPAPSIGAMHYVPVNQDPDGFFRPSGPPIVPSQEMLHEFRPASVALHQQLQPCVTPPRPPFPAQQVQLRQHAPARVSTMSAYYGGVPQPVGTPAPFRTIPPGFSVSSPAQSRVLSTSSTSGLAADFKRKKRPNTPNKSLTPHRTKAKPLPPSRRAPALPPARVDLTEVAARALQAMRSQQVEASLEIQDDAQLGDLLSASPTRARLLCLKTYMHWSRQTASNIEQWNRQLSHDNFAVHIPVRDLRPWPSESRNFSVKFNEMRSPIANKDIEIMVAAHFAAAKAWEQAAQNYFEGVLENSACQSLIPGWDLRVKSKQGGFVVDDASFMPEADHNNKYETLAHSHLIRLLRYLPDKIHRTDVPHVKKAGSAGSLVCGSFLEFYYRHMNRAFLFGKPCEWHYRIIRCWSALTNDWETFKYNQTVDPNTQELYFYPSSFTSNTKWTHWNGWLGSIIKELLSLTFDPTISLWCQNNFTCCIAYEHFCCAFTRSVSAATGSLDWKKFDLRDPSHSIHIARWLDGFVCTTIRKILTFKQGPQNVLYDSLDSPENNFGFLRDFTKPVGYPSHEHTKSFLALPLHKRVISKHEFERFCKSDKGSTLDREDGLIYFDLTATPIFKTRKRARDSDFSGSHVDLWGEMFKFQKALLSNEAKVAAIRNFLKSVILVCFDPSRINVSFILSHIANLCVHQVEETSQAEIPACGSRPLDCDILCRRFAYEKSSFWSKLFAIDKSALKVKYTQAQKSAMQLISDHYTIQIPNLHSLFALDYDIETEFHELNYKIFGSASIQLSRRVGASERGFSERSKEFFSALRQSKLNLEHIHGKQRIVPTKAEVTGESPDQREEEFTRNATNAPHPYQVPKLADARILQSSFIAILKPGIVAEIRSKRESIIEKIASLIEPIETELMGHRPVHLTRLSPTHRPLLMSCLGSILDWPDRHLGWDTFYGFKIIGYIKAQKIFSRPNFKKELEKDLFDLQDHPERWCLRQMKRISKEELERAMVTSGYSELNQGERTLMDKTMQELDNLESAGLFSKQEMDAKFGKDAWRNLLRFIVWSAMKFREIDSGLSAGHNAGTIVCERIDVDTIHTPDDFVHYMKLYWEHCDVHFRADTFIPVGGTEDLKRAYRQAGVRVEHLRYNITLLPWCGKPRFSLVFGLVFGLTSAVYQFNRISQFLNFVARATLYLQAGHYFDDFLQIENEPNAYKAKKALKKICKLMGWLLDRKKSISMSKQVRWLGIWKVLSSYGVKSKIVEKRKENILFMIQTFRDTKSLTASEAGTFRGKTGFIANSIFGRCGYIALAALKQRQYRDVESSELTDDILYALEFIELLVEHAPCAVTFAGSTTHRRHLVIATDASSEPVNADVDAVEPDVSMLSNPDSLDSAPLGVSPLVDLSASVDADSVDSLPPLVASAITDNLLPSRYSLNEGSEWDRSVRLGWVAFEHGLCFHAGATDIDIDILNYWRKIQPIYQAECVGILQGLIKSLEAAGNPNNIDVTMYVDNLGALGTMIRGSSAKCCFGDQLANCLHLYTSFRGIRIYFEFVPSALNCSDEPSRTGLCKYFKECKFHALVPLLRPASADDHARFGMNRKFVDAEIARFHDQEKVDSASVSETDFPRFAGSSFSN